MATSLKEISQPFDGKSATLNLFDSKVGRNSFWQGIHFEYNQHNLDMEMIHMCVLVFSCSDLTVNRQITVMPNVRIPEREERRLPRQCNLQKKGSLLLTPVRAPATRPTQWYGVRERRAQAVTQFIRCA